MYRGTGISEPDLRWSDLEFPADYNLDLPLTDAEDLKELRLIGRVHLEVFGRSFAGRTDPCDNLT